MKKQDVVVVKVSIPNICWQCNHDLDNKSLFCSNCGVLIENNLNYFEIFDLETKFNIESGLIEKKYFDLQLKIHPDKFINKKDYERMLAAKYSAIINDAYKTLENIRLRAQYLLAMKGIIVNGDNDSIKPSNEMLSEIFILRDRVENSSDLEELSSLKQHINEQTRNYYESITEMFANNELLSIAQLLIKIRYYEKICEEISVKI